MIGEHRVAKLQLLLLPLVLLTSCGQQPQPEKPSQLATTQSDKGEMDEVHSLVQAVKANPSVSDPAEAGPPIHVDPYPKSAGAHHSPQMPMNNMTH